MTKRSDSQGNDIGDQLRQVILEIENDPDVTFASFSIHRFDDGNGHPVSYTVSFASRNRNDKPKAPIFPKIRDYDEITFTKENLKP